jgi:flagellar motor switch protein FliG
MVEARKANGIDRAAILLFSLGEDAAASILRHMDVDEVQRVGSAMAALQNVPRGDVSAVLGELLIAVDGKTTVGLGAQDYMKAVFTNALGERKASSLLGRIFTGRKSQGIESLQYMEPKAVARVIREENPQIVATILAHFTAEQAAQVLQHMPVELQGPVALRIARLNSVSETALKDLDSIVEEQTQAVESMKSARIGGVKMAADIINRVSKDTETAILELIKNEDANLLEAIEQSLFNIETLLSVDDSAIQLILREIQSATLIIALKGADEAVRNKMLNNMSKRAAEILRDDLAAKGPVRVSEVEKAQREILTVAQRLAEEGQIVLGKGDDFV